MKVGFTPRAGNALKSAPGGETPCAQDCVEGPTDEKKEGRGCDLWGEVSRTGGYFFHGLSKLPTAYRYVPNLLQFAFVEGLITTVQVTAGLTGLAGMAGLSVAGLRDIYTGAQDRDLSRVLSGSGEVSRGLFIGGLAMASWDLGSLAGPVAYGAHSLGYGHGILSCASGILKLKRGIEQNNRVDRIVGLLECGMGAASFAIMAGVGTVPFLAIQGSLAAAKFTYTNWDTLKSVGKAIKSRAKQLGDKFGRIFRESPKPKPEETLPTRPDIKTCPVPKPKPAFPPAPRAPRKPPPQVEWETGPNGKLRMKWSSVQQSGSTGESQAPNSA